jgi:biotin carboxyl carrier protein
MKMELAISAPFDGVVESLMTKVGEQIGEGVPLVRIAKGE